MIIIELILIHKLSTGVSVLGGKGIDRLAGLIAEDRPEGRKITGGAGRSGEERKNREGCRERSFWGLGFDYNCRHRL
jgi:hypothetical protein